MKPPRVIGVLILCVAGVILGTVLLGRNKVTPPAPEATPASATTREQVFNVRGRVISLDEHSGIVKIAHEEIPNYMPAMTMPFMVRDSNSLRKLKQGDLVRFKLAVSSDDSWISEIERTAEGIAIAPAPAAAQDSEDPRLTAGEKIPSIAFTDQNGTLRNIAEFQGKFLVLTFIYTRCPLPNFCPALNKKFAELQDRLSKEFPGKFHLLSISIDPANDTPQVLKRYAALQEANESNWTFATGTAEQIGEIAGLFGLTYKQKSPGLIDHDMRTALIAPDGRVIHIWKSNFWTPYEIRNRVEEEIKGKEVALRR